MKIKKLGLIDNFSGVSEFVKKITDFFLETFAQAKVHLVSIEYL